VEFCFRLRFDEKIRDGLTKSLLRRAVADILPPQVAYRRDKKGMPTPYVQFFTRPSSVAALRDLLEHGELARRGILDSRGTVKMLKTLRNRLKPIPTAVLSSIWRIATLELWFRRFILAD